VSAVPARRPARAVYTTSLVVFLNPASVIQALFSQQQPTGLVAERVKGTEWRDRGQSIRERGSEILAGTTIREAGPKPKSDNRIRKERMGKGEMLPDRGGDAPTLPSHASVPWISADTSRHGHWPAVPCGLCVLSRTCTPCATRPCRGSVVFFPRSTRFGSLRNCRHCGFPGPESDPLLRP